MLPRAVVLVIATAWPALGQVRVDTIVRNAGKPVHASIAALAQEISIGLPDGDDHYMLGHIADIAVAPNGAIYIFDKSVPTIRMYDAAGKYLKSIGHKGNGPGEYNPGSAIAVAKNGNLLMWEPANSRINVYSPTGEVITHWPTGGSSSTSSGTNLLMVDTAGSLCIVRSGFSPTERTFRSFWQRIGPSGLKIDTVDAPPFAVPPLQLTALNGGSSASAGVPFAPVQLRALSPFGYFITALPDRYAFEIHDAPARVVSVRRDIPQRAVSASERDSARAFVEGMMQRTQPGWSWNGPDIPRVKAAFIRIDVRSDGRIWILVEQGPRHLKPGEAPTPPPMASIGGGQGPGRGGLTGGSNCPSNGADVYDVFEPTGLYLGQVRVPERTKIDEARGDLVWASTCDDDDVPMVKRFRIIWK